MSLWIRQTIRHVKYIWNSLIRSWVMKKNGLVISHQWWLNYEAWNIFTQVEVFTFLLKAKKIAFDLDFLAKNIILLNFLCWWCHYGCLEYVNVLNNFLNNLISIFWRSKDNPCKIEGFKMLCNKSNHVNKLLFQIIIFKVLIPKYFNRCGYFNMCC